jgi:hypothetical protein
MSSVTRRGCTGYGRTSAPESWRARGARWSGTATRCEFCARLTAIRMHLSSVLVLWFRLAMLRYSNKIMTAAIPIENYLAQETPVLA